MDALTCRILLHQQDNNDNDIDIDTTSISAKSKRSLKTHALIVILNSITSLNSTGKYY